MNFSNFVEQVDQLRSQRFVHTLLSNSFRERLEGIMMQGQALPAQRRRRGESRPLQAATTSEQATPAPPPAPPQAMRVNREADQSRIEPQAFDRNVPARSSREIPFWRRLYEIREAMQAAELADLHLRRSVSSTLESDFRNRLEALIQDIINQQVW